MYNLSNKGTSILPLIIVLVLFSFIECDNKLECSFKQYQEVYK